MSRAFGDTPSKLPPGAAHADGAAQPPEVHAANRAAADRGIKQVLSTSPASTGGAAPVHTGYDAVATGARLDAAIASKNVRAALAIFPAVNLATVQGPNHGFDKNSESAIGALLTPSRVSALQALIAAHRFEVAIDKDSSDALQVLMDFGMSLPAGRQLNDTLDQPELAGQIEKIVSAGDPLPLVEIIKQSPGAVYSYFWHHPGPQPHWDAIWSATASLLIEHREYLADVRTREALSYLSRAIPAASAERLLTKVFGMQVTDMSASDAEIAVHKGQPASVNRDLAGITLGAALDIPEGNGHVLRRTNVETKATGGEWNGHSIEITKFDNHRGILHELGHAIDDALGSPSIGPLFGWSKLTSAHELAKAAHLSEIEAASPKVAAVVLDCYQKLYDGQRNWATLVAAASKAHGVADADIIRFLAHPAYQAGLAADPTAANTNPRHLPPVGEHRVFFHGYYGFGYALRNDLYDAYSQLGRDRALYAPQECFADLYVAWFGDTSKPKLPAALASYFRDVVTPFDGAKTTSQPNKLPA